MTAGRRSRKAGATAAAALAVAVLAPRGAGAHGWVRDPGSAYVKASVGGFASAESEEGAGLSYSDRTARLYAEVGVADGVQLRADGAYVWAANEDAATGTRYLHAGLGDALLGVRCRLLAAPAALALGVDVRTAPYARARDVAGYDAAPGRFPDLGDGQVDVAAGLGVGVSLGHTPAWLGAWAAYQGRSGAFVDTALASADAGFLFADRVGLSAGVDGAFALSDDERTKSWVALRATAWVELGGGFAVEAFGARMPWSRNTEAGFSVLAGVSWKR